MKKPKILILIMYSTYKVKKMNFHDEDERFDRGNFAYSDSTHKTDLETWGSDWHLYW
jgi:hypothetical protein